MFKPVVIQAERRTNERERERERERETETDRQTDREAGRQAGRQTNTEIERERVCVCARVRTPVNSFCPHRGWWPTPRPVTL